MHQRNVHLEISDWREAFWNTGMDVDKGPPQAINRLINVTKCNQNQYGLACALKQVMFDWLDESHSKEKVSQRIIHCLCIDFWTEDIAAVVEWCQRPVCDLLSTSVYSEVLDLLRGLHNLCMTQPLHMEKAGDLSSSTSTLVLSSLGAFWSLFGCLCKRQHQAEKRSLRILLLVFQFLRLAFSLKDAKITE